MASALLDGSAPFMVTEGGAQGFPEVLKERREKDREVVWPKY
jgi:hypothetical protein